MIYITENTHIPTVEETINTLKMHQSMMPEFVDFDKIMMNINFLQVQLEPIQKELFSYIGKPTGVDAKDNMKYWLARNADTSGFKATKTGLSLDKPSIAGAIESGTLTDEQISVLNIYQKYSNYVKMRGTLISLLQNPVSNAPSCDGHRMLILHPEWAAQNTGRVGMRNPAIQNFDHALQEITTVPEGYVLLHTDSGQIEPRITYSAYIKDPQIKALIMLYNDAYYGILHYITMPEEDILSSKMDFVAAEITPEMKEGRQKIKTYTNAVMYGSKSNPTGDPIKAAMIKRIGGHHSRLKLVEEYNRAIESGITVFKTAFGTPIDTSNSAKFEGEGMKAATEGEERLRLAINNPIQGTAADLMRVSVYEANKILMNRGKKSYIIDYVHDAGRFCIHEDDMEAVSKELGDIVSYMVDDWIPIYAEPEFGRDGGKKGLILDLY